MSYFPTVLTSGHHSVYMIMIIIILLFFFLANGCVVKVSPLKVKLVSLIVSCHVFTMSLILV